MVAQWRVPDGMTMHIHEYDAREGGRYRISLAYNDTDIPGKTATNADTYHGEFTKLVVNELIIEKDEFESGDVSLQGAMVSTYRLGDVDGGTLVECTHENVPTAVPAQENQTGWEMALRHLAALVEAD
jgi:uncharacterized protein YndB with AHSA1/START domain